MVQDTISVERYRQDRSAWLAILSCLTANGKVCMADCPDRYFPQHTVMADTAFHKQLRTANIQIQAYASSEVICVIKTRAHRCSHKFDVHRQSKKA